MSEKSLKDKIEESTNMQRRVLISFPIKIFRDFDLFCKENTADCYWLGIENLLTLFKRQA